MLLPIVASAVIGGIIGYLTNWVAIKMLFRPLHAKYIFGLRVPFTPGLIPKQRNELAKSIGGAVGDYLLTSEAVLETIHSEQFKKSAEEFLTHSLGHLRNDDRSLRDFLQDLDLLKHTDYVQQSLAQEIQRISMDNVFQEKAAEIISASLDQLLDTPITETLDENLRKGSTSVLKEILCATLANGHINLFVQNVLEEHITSIVTSDMTVGELLPPNAIETLKEAIASLSPQIVATVKETLESQEGRVLVETLVSKFISSSLLGKLISNFMDINAIAANITDQLVDITDKPHTLSMTSSATAKLIDRLAGIPAREISQLFSEQMILRQVDSLMNKVLNDNMIERLSKWGANSLVSFEDKTWREVATSLCAEERFGYLNDWTLRILQRVSTSESFASLVNSGTKEAFDLLLSKKPSNLLERINNQHIGAFTDFTLKHLERFIERYGTSLFVALNIPKMVEKQVDKLEVLEVENVLLSVMNNQLKNITNLGLLLGAVIGILMPFINMWLMKP